MLKWVSLLLHLLIMFFLTTALAAVFFPYDSSCADIQAEDICLSKDSYLRLYKACRWSKRHEACTYNSPEFSSYQILIYVNAVVLISMIINRWVDYALIRSIPFVQLCCRVMVKQYLKVFKKSRYRIGEMSESFDSFSIGISTTEDLISDEIRDLQTLKTNMLRAVRVTKLREHMDDLQPVVAVHELTQELNRQQIAKKADLQFKTVFRKFDLPRRKSVYELFSGPLRSDRMIEEMKLARQQALTINQRLTNESLNTGKEQILLQWFIFNTLSTPFRPIINTRLLSDKPQIDMRTSSFNFILILGLALTIVILSVLFDGLVVETNVDLWALCLSVALTEYFFLIEVLVILCKDVIMMQMVVGRELYQQWNLFATRAKLILMRSTGIIRDTQSLVQLFNPACIIARLHPHLPVSRLLISISDSDLKLPVTKSSMIVGWIAKNLTALFLLPYQLLPYEVAPLVFDIAVLVIVFGIALVFNFLGSRNLTLALSIISVVAGVIILREIFYQLNQYRKKKAEKFQENVKILDQFFAEANLLEDIYQEDQGSVMENEIASLRMIRKTTSQMDPNDLEVTMGGSPSSPSKRFLDEKGHIIFSKLNGDSDSFLDTDSFHQDFTEDRSVGEGVMDRTVPHIMGFGESEKAGHDPLLFPSSTDALAIHSTLKGVGKRSKRDAPRYLPPIVDGLYHHSKTAGDAHSLKPTVQDDSTEGGSMVFYSHRERRRMYMGRADESNNKSGPGGHIAEELAKETVDDSFLDSSLILDLNYKSPPKSPTKPIVGASRLSDCLLIPAGQELPTIDILASQSDDLWGSISPGSDRPPTPMNQTELHQGGRRGGRFSPNKKLRSASVSPQKQEPGLQLDLETVFSESNEQQDKKDNENDDENGSPVLQIEKTIYPTFL